MAATEEGELMSKDTLHERVARLARKAGPHVTDFAGYVSEQLYERARRTALDLGLSTMEAELIAATTAAGAMKSFASACKQAQWERQFQARQQ